MQSLAAAWLPRLSMRSLANISYPHFAQRVVVVIVFSGQRPVSGAEGIVPPDIRIIAQYQYGVNRQFARLF